MDHGTRSEKQILNTTEAASALGVGPSTVKRWADEGVLPHTRTAGGHRRFRRVDVESLLDNTRSDLNTGSNSKHGSTHAKEWLEFLRTHDDLYAVAARLLEACVRLESWCGVASELGDVLVEVGLQWSAGQLSVVEEHIITERIMRAVAWCGRMIPVSPSAPTCMLICAEGDEHVAGLTLVELCARATGWRTIWAGRGTPLSALEDYLDHQNIEMLAVSASAISSDPEALQSQYQRLVELARPRGISLVLGGAGAWPTQLEYGVRLNTLESLHRLLDAANTVY